MKKSHVVVLLLFVVHTSNTFAQMPDTPVCIPLDEDGAQVAILIQGEIPSDKINALQQFIREQMSEADSGEEPLRVAILRNGACFPLD